ncbi:MAG: hypothetical protein NUW37_15600 [Planctomycetes bacterium]|nr:hypothetical protein [Planctomycetota bacterium]
MIPVKEQDGTTAFEFEENLPATGSEEITQRDKDIFFKATSHSVPADVISRIEGPTNVHPTQRSTIAVHWHPEFLSFETIRKRIDTMFPNSQDELIIPTQHNELLHFGEWAGVEIDCYAKEYNLKVQLLAHFHGSKVRNADVLKSMLEHIYLYRASQLDQFFEAICDESGEKLRHKAAKRAGTPDSVCEFVLVTVRKIRALVARHRDDVPRDMLRNKLLKGYFDELKDYYDPQFINLCQSYLRVIKTLVKKRFSPHYFYSANEIVEEVRGLGGCLVIPHPEQFWPILLSGIDVDGIEVWNPASRRFTEFLISVVVEKNKSGTGKRRLLITMGDDCHMGEKTRDLHKQDKKALREIGFQPAWDDMNIKKILRAGNFDKQSVIDEYKTRLRG